MLQPLTRRDVLMGGTALTLSASHAAADPSPSANTSVDGHTTAVGRVTEIMADADHGSVGGAPVVGVIVSNGRDVVRTDTEGRFGLPIAPGQAIFLVKPSGFRVPVDPVTNLAHFSYVHDPEGTPTAPRFRYRGLPPTGPLPASLAFHLIRAPEPKAFNVVLLTDPQPETTTEMEFIRDDVVASLIGVDAAFGMTCGDLMFDDLSMYHRYNRIIGRIGVPWWNIGGNHDLDYEASDSRRSRDTFKRVFGATYYAHEHADALFIMLDNVDYLGAKSDGGRGSYRGYISPDQLVFVRNLLTVTPEDRLIVLAMHIPLRTDLDPKDPARNTANAAALLALLGNRPSVSFSGHTHSTEHHYLGAEEGVTGAMPHHHHVLTAVSGSWWSGPLDHRGIASADSYDGTPNGYHVLSIDGTRYTTRYVSAAEPARTSMRISLETQFHQDDREGLRELSMAALLRSPISTDQAGATTVVVNVFDGGPRTTVTYTIDGGAPVPMTKVARPDPFITQVYARHPETIKKWVTPQMSSHIWVAPLPADLKPGSYALKVQAIDEYGRDLSDAMVLEVV